MLVPLLDECSSCHPRACPEDPAPRKLRRMVSTQQRYWAYILASKPLHRARKGSGVTAKYDVAMLVWFEEFNSIEEAIQREKSLKRYLRQWKINLIEQSNPQWIDLYPGLAARNDFGDRAF